MSEEQFDVKKVEDALAANRALQETIKAELLRLRKVKQHNRLLAASLVEKRLSSRIKSTEPSTVTSAIISFSDWKNRFFEDDDGNAAPSIYDGDNREFFKHLRPPWSTQESKKLVKVVDSAIAANIPVGERYERVAEVLKPPEGQGLKRSPEECRIEYIRQCEKPLTKLEIQKLEFLVGQLPEDEVDWIVIAEQMSVGRARPCSAFQCLSTLKKIDHGSQKRKTFATWTPTEDKLLLKFILAAGPQLLLDGGHPLVRWTLCQELLPDKTRKHIFDRAQWSSLNPKLADGEWTDYEERKLTILMKVYGGDIFAASTHLDRARKAVSDKWQRTLNPEYLTGPFTKEDDKRLVSIVRSQPESGWRDIARQHFPERHPQRLMNRWLDLASDQDIIAREQKSRKRSRQKK